MVHRPGFDEFQELAGKASIVPIYRQLLADTLTPVTAFRRIDEGSQGFLFESVIGGERVGRYSFVGSAPFMRFRAWGDRVVIEDCQAGGERHELRQPDPLRLLEDLLRHYRVPHLPGLPRFAGGIVGYAAYDTVRYTESLPNPPPDDRGLPDLSFDFYDRMVIFDHINKSVAVVAHAHVEEGSLHSVYQQACRRVDELVDRLRRERDALPIADIQPKGEVRLPFESNFSREAFEQAVERCKEYIRAGDIFQVVLSQRLTVPTQVDPFDVYRTLRVVNPSPFMFFVRTEDLTLVGASPEIMVRVEGDKVTIRPLAGTCRRGRNEEEDLALAKELLADPKERAEHIMLVDLGRNDVGRVARYGTVQLSDVMSVERYSHVMHICSNVTGRLRPECSAFDALRSCLPAGTLSGAPKVRAMEIIDELEPHRRGPYGGAVGYVDFTGNMDTCIALRTLILKDGKAYVQAGAGIVADSIPANEYQETLNKAMGLLRALELAEGLTR